METTIPLFPELFKPFLRGCTASLSAKNRQILGTTWELLGDALDIFNLISYTRRHQIEEN